MVRRDGRVRLKTFSLGRELVVLGREEVVHVADGLEEDVQARVAFDIPKDAAVLEPGVGKNPMQPAEYVDEVLNRNALVMRITQDDDSAGKYLGIRDDIGRPVEGVAAVVDSATTLGLLVDGAQKLPLGGAHLGTGGGTAGRRVEEEADDEVVALRDEEAAELVEPQGPIDRRWRRRELDGRRAGYGLRVAGRVVIVEGGEVFLELEGRIELQRELAPSLAPKMSKTRTNLVQWY